MRLLTPLVFTSLLLSEVAYPATLRQAIDQAIKASPKLSSKQYARESSQLSLENSLASYWPQLTASSSMGAGGHYPVGTGGNAATGHTSSLDIRLSETIWDGGLRGSEQDRSQIAMDIAELNYLEARDQLILDIAKAYIDFSEAEAIFSAQKTNVEISKKQFLQTESFFKQGLTPRRDFLRSQAEVQRLQLSAAQSQDQINRLKDLLQNLIGAPSTGGGNLNFEPLIPQPRLVANDRSSSPGPKEALAVRRDRLQKSASDIALKIERQKTLWPTVGISATSSYGAKDFVGPRRTAFQDQDEIQFSLSLEVNYTLWDWGTARRNIEKLVLQQSQENSEREIQLNNLSLQRASSAKGLDFTAKNYQLSQDLLRLDEDAYKTVESDFHQGRTTFLDVGDALAKLLESRTSASRSYFSYLRSTWDSYFYEGIIYEKAMAL
jgi:outer membrane protein